MDEFWALVLGAILATLGGIITEIIIFKIQQRKDKKDKKTEAYIKILTFLHTIKFTKSSEKEFTFQQIAEVTALGKLYGSEKMQQCYDMAVEAISNMYNLAWQSEEYEKKIKEVNSLISVLTAQMKKEINLSDNNSEKLLQLTLERKETENAN